MSARLSIGDVVLVHLTENDRNMSIKQAADIQMGVIKYIGFIQGHGMTEYIGIESVEPVKNGHKGTINGYQYFDAPQGHGIHIRVTNVIRKLQASEVSFKMQDVIRTLKARIEEYINCLSQRDEYIEQLKDRQNDLRKIIKEYKNIIPSNPITNENSFQHMSDELFTDIDSSSFILLPKDPITGSVLKLGTYNSKDNNYKLTKKRMTFESDARYSINSFESNSYGNDSSFYHEDKREKAAPLLNTIDENRRFSDDHRLPSRSTLKSGDFSQSTYTETFSSTPLPHKPVEKDKQRRTPKRKLILKKRRSSISSLHELKKLMQQESEWSDTYDDEYNYSSDEDGKEDKMSNISIRTRPRNGQMKTHNNRNHKIKKSMHSQFVEYTTTNQLPLSPIHSGHKSPPVYSSPSRSLMQSQSDIDFDCGSPLAEEIQEQPYMWKHAVPEIKNKSNKFINKKGIKNEGSKNKSTKVKNKRKNKSKGKGKQKTSRRRSSSWNPLPELDIIECIQQPQKQKQPQNIIGYMKYQHQQQFRQNIGNGYPSPPINAHQIQYSAPINYDNRQMQMHTIATNNLSPRQNNIKTHQMQFSAPIDYNNKQNMKNIIVNNNINNNNTHYYTQPQIEQWMKSMKHHNAYHHK